ncbi:uncharacterized protein ACLA_032200 [Aspergillus clavatus NRRL 1]|uniref:Uncharacterized protein n=1 Tax=Aspergillus clavatus (strain ATCC 1007 / CBS 513.65 / DSM 816 / NCTC 3887 / NRRL 1 / QM 1276 / 107) TaxID=344612 RepID=A1CS64_ASPCL|nr:uncharacterized protein ACLA_032200 [Aspergillus clavatus NRRL 1]EAW08485.1 hypothetical protein ACLA_032200 [Aspergillus clavatus NRRL 1]
MAPSKKSAGKGVGKRFAPVNRKAPAKPRNSKKMTNNLTAATASAGPTPQSEPVDASVSTQIQAVDTLANTPSQPAFVTSNTQSQPTPVLVNIQPQPAASSEDIPAQPVAAPANATPINANGHSRAWNNEFRLQMLLTLLVKLDQRVSEQMWHDVAHELDAIRPGTSWNAVRLEFSRLKREHFQEAGKQTSSDQQEQEQ